MAPDDPKVINGIKARLDETYLAAETLAAPSRYDIAVSVVCDLKCPLCPRQRIADQIVSGFLKPEAFEAVAPWLRFSERTGLYGLGEPFLNRKFFDYLAAAKSNGSYTMTSTHGMSLSEEVARRLIEMELDELAVSMDACTPGLFRRLRANAELRVVCANVRRLVRLREAAGASRPRVHIACAVSRENVNQMAAMPALARWLGADRLVFSNIIFVKREDARLNAVGGRRFRWGLAAARWLGRRLGVETLYFYQNPFPWNPDGRRFAEGARFGCPAAWGAYVVERDGNLKPCCYLDDSLGVAGGGVEFSGNFNNEAARALRRSLLEGRPGANCRDCGMLVEVSRAHVERCLREARERIGAAELSPAAREELLALAARYEALAAQRFGE